MKTNLYWNDYKELESELIDIKKKIFIDDKQIETYSLNCADLLVKTSTCIESLAKELYRREGGEEPERGFLPFDNVCLKFLEEKWQLSKKVVNLVGDGLRVENEENMRFHPLAEAFERGKGEWKKAYQAVKHDRSNNIETGTVRNFMLALAAYYLLNIYYAGEEFDLQETNLQSLDNRFESSVFSVNVHPFPGINASGYVYRNQELLDECTYRIVASGETYNHVVEVLKGFDSAINGKAMELAVEEVNKNIDGMGKDDILKQVMEYFGQKRDEAISIVQREKAPEIARAFASLRYRVELNKELAPAPAEAVVAK